MIRSAIRSYCYRHREVIHTRRNGRDKLYVCDNSVLKEFITSLPGYRHEYDVLSKLNHPSIICVSDHFYEKDKFYMVMPFHRKGDIWQKIRHSNPNHLDLLMITRSLAKPIAHIHQRDLVHLDVKLENYVEGDSENYIMIDFEHARWFRKNYYDLESLDQIVGTTPYMAPEIRTLQYGPTSDVYSLGRVLYTIIARRHPDVTDIDWSPVCAKAPDLEKLVVAMLQPNHLMRPTVFDILRDVNSLIYRCPENILV
jgi:serine/threonine protein kinase